VEHAVEAIAKVQRLASEIPTVTAA